MRTSIAGSKIFAFIPLDYSFLLREKGLKPGGVYVRKGSSTQPMTEEGIREMIIQNSGRSFELCRCMNQELTFHTFQTEMQRRSIEIGSSQMRTLKLTGEDGLYTNLALLLSDQCETTTKVAVFQGTDKELFRDRKEFTGSLLKQLEDVYQFLDLVNKTKATFSGLNRTDTRDYPEDGAHMQDNRDANVSLNEQKDFIVQYAQENGSVTRKEVEGLIGAGTTKAFRLLKELCKAGRLEQKGGGKLSTYVIK